MEYNKINCQHTKRNGETYTINSTYSSYSNTSQGGGGGTNVNLDNCYKVSGGTISGNVEIASALTIQGSGINVGDSSKIYQGSAGGKLEIRNTHGVIISDNLTVNSTISTTHVKANKFTDTNKYQYVVKRAIPYNPNCRTIYYKQSSNLNGGNTNVILNFKLPYSRVSEVSGKTYQVNGLSNLKYNLVFNHIQTKGKLSFKNDALTSYKTSDKVTVSFKLVINQPVFIKFGNVDSWSQGTNWLDGINSINVIPAIDYKGQFFSFDTTDKWLKVIDGRCICVKPLGLRGMIRELFFYRNDGKVLRNYTLKYERKINKYRSKTNTQGTYTITKIINPKWRWYRRMTHYNRKNAQTTRAFWGLHKEFIRVRVFAKHRGITSQFFQEVSAFKQSAASEKRLNFM